MLLSTLACTVSPPQPKLPQHGLSVPVRLAEARTPEAKLSAGLQGWQGGARKRPILVDFTEQVDLQRLVHELSVREIDRTARRRIVVAALRLLADRSQKRLQPVLRRLQDRGLVGESRGFSVLNRLLVEATSDGIRELARRPEVATIVEESESEEPIWSGQAPGQAVGSRRSWAIAATGAEQAWQAGLNGRNVVVGILDSGASAVHEQLRGNFRGGATSWYDPAGGNEEPRDGALGHGSGVLSVAVGQNVAGVTLGVAPGARWVACAALPEGRFNNVLLTLCADWIVNVAQPDVLINAWLLPEAGCELSFQPIVDAWRAAEILPVFAAGNYGPEAGSDRSPANYVGLVGGGPALSVGGLAANGEAFQRSVKGPSSCDPGGVFPSLTAPAEDVTVAIPLTPSTYLQAEGTSYAAGLVAGAAALLLQRHPEASVMQLEDALRTGAVDLGPPGPDSQFGYGSLFIPRALEALAGIMRQSSP